MANLREEKKLWKKGYKHVVGLDEAGIGPLAGPVTAAAVTIRPAKIKNIQQSWRFLRQRRTNQKSKIRRIRFKEIYKRGGKNYKRSCRESS